MYIRKSIFSVALAVGLVSTAHALPPYYPDLVSDGNRWTITAYNDASTVHQQWATQGICFYPTGTNGTHQMYYWISDTFPDWNGRAVQEGDQIFMHGDYANDVGHDSMTWEITVASRASDGHGHWVEWREDQRLGRTIGFVNAALQRVGKCNATTWEEALEVNRDIKQQVNADGELVVVPFGFSERELEEQQYEK